MLIGVLLAAGAVCVAAVVRVPRTDAHRFYGATALLAIFLLVAYTAASVVWSLAPADSWLEANRTLAYAAAFATGIALVRLAPRAYGGLLAGIAIACLAISLWALLTKVFPSALAGDETYARLRAPFQYWNSVGLMAALGVPPMLWLGARRPGGQAVNALAWPVIALLLVCLMLSYSRGALLTLVFGCGFWLAVVPLRRTGVIILGAAILFAAPVVVWAFAQDGLTTDRAPMAARVDAGHEFGALLLLMSTVLLIGGLAWEFARSQRGSTPGPPLRRRVVAVATAVVVLGVGGAAAAAPGSLNERVSQEWQQLTDPNAATPANTPDRLTATSSVRARYWDEAFKVHGLSPWLGTGAGAYAIVRNRYRHDALAVRHAHGYVPQTLADLGWAGLAVSLLALLAWLWAAARSAGLYPRARWLPFDAERVGIATLAAVVLAFGVHSALDWTWFVPANVLPVMLAAGWVAGSRPLGERLRDGVADDQAPEPPATQALWRRPAAFARRRPLVSASAVLIVLISLTAAWTAYQPVRALHAGEDAFVDVEVGAYERAVVRAREATKRNPLSVDALFDLATIEQARGQLGASEAALESAVRLEPANAETWRRLGRLRLDAIGKPDR
ncbi:MAG TPA: O-antigen ligase family protein, partial [Gemmatimonadaceae bacterium]|nr:O-antigen ligase family protein [Gemmatimonadaceae bacterium]